MDSRILFLVAVLMTACNATFNPTVVFSCNSGPVYNVSLTNAVAGGIIFIENYCAQQAINSTTSEHTFDTAACTAGGVPSLGTDFYIVIQEYSTFSQDSDVRIKANCTADLQSQTQVVNVSSSGGAGFDSESTDTIAPSFTTSITNTNGPITAGTVGDAADITVSLSDPFEASTFGFRVATVDFSGITIISAGCSSYGFFANPGLPTSGSLTMPITLVRPMTSSDLDLTAATLSITITLEVCNGNCTAYTCTRRKRRSDDEEGSTLTTKKTYATLLVYPPGQRPNDNSVDSYISNNDVSLDDVCFSRTPMVAVLVCLALALVVCVTISGWMYCKLRYAGPKKAADGFSNNGYKA